jgi:predicted nicotinamide N-methyase
MKRVFRIPYIPAAVFSGSSNFPSPGSSGFSTPVGTDCGGRVETAVAEITLHEPALTADNLGLKTWASSYLLAKRLSLLGLPALGEHNGEGGSRVLELGAGTGLVGLAAAKIFGARTVLTDLPEIVGNLERNVRANSHLDIDVKTAVLDWNDVPERTVAEGEKFKYVLAADPLYSSEHPRLLVGMVNVWLKKDPRARVVVEMPLRKGYEKEREDFRDRMQKAGLEIVDEGRETGWDDWGERGGEVRCWWSVWRWAWALELEV